MSIKIEVDVDEVRRVFSLLEEVNSLFHQPLKHKDINLVVNFAENNYPEIKELYYDLVWNWLPKDVQEEIENS